MASIPSHSDRDADHVARRLEQLDASEETVYRDAVAVAAQLCGTSFAALTLASGDGFACKAWVGSADVPCRSLAPFAARVAETEAPLVDTAATDTDSPLRFRCGVRLVINNVAAGTLCVMDGQPKTLTNGQLDGLAALARQVSASLDYRLLVQSSADDQYELKLAIEEASEKELLLRHSAERFESLFAKLPVACMTLDVGGRIMEWNAMSEALYGYSAPEVLFKTVIDLVIPRETRRAAKRAFREAIKKGGYYATSEWAVMRKDGSLACVLSTGFPLHGPNGDLVGLISTNVDITDRKQAEALLLESNVLIEGQRLELQIANSRLETLAFTDGLTGLNNHRSFQDNLLRAFIVARRYQQSLSVIILDVDKFKAYNDQFGHLQGDAILRRVADLLRASARESDFVGRYGGEEFAVVLPNTDLEGASEVAERIRRTIEDEASVNRQVTVSLGVASLTLSTLDTADLMRRADDALYRSKAEGRNRTSVHREQPGVGA